MTFRTLKSLCALVAVSAALVAAVLPAHAADDLTASADQMKAAIADLRAFPGEAYEASRAVRAVNWGPDRFDSTCGYNCFIFCFDTQRLQYSTSTLPHGAAIDVGAKLDLLPLFAVAASLHFNLTRDWVKVDVLDLKANFDRQAQQMNDGAAMVSQGNGVAGKEKILKAIASLTEMVAKQEDTMRKRIESTGRFSLKTAEIIQVARNGVDRVTGYHWSNEKNGIERYASNARCGQDDLMNFRDDIGKKAGTAGRETIDLISKLSVRANAADNANALLVGVLNNMLGTYREFSDRVQAVPPEGTPTIVRIRLAIAKRQLDEMLKLSQSVE